MEDWKETFQREMDSARRAQMEGNTGRARVCARRAAGAAAGEILRLMQSDDIPASALERLQILEKFPNLPQEIMQTARQLLLRVDTQFNLPEQVDLFADAQKLADFASAETSRRSLHG
ncbi:MAG: hypothetical protein ABFD44_11750 [Anaerolineaceae bacterium]